MSRYFIEPVDPAEMASRFSTEDSLDPFPEMDEEWKGTHLEKIKSVLDFLPDKEADYIRLYYFKDKKQVDIAKIFDVTQAAVSYRIKRGKERLRFILDMPDLDKHEVYNKLSNFMTRRNAEIFREMYETSCQTEVADRLNLGQGCVRHRFLKNLRKLGQRFIDRLSGWVSENDHKIRPAEVDLVDHRVEELKEEDNLEDSEFEDKLFEVVEILESMDEGDEELIDNLDSIQQFGAIYRVFVRIRYNFNILREVELPKWSNDPSRKIS
jgi:hypothetical protein